MSERVCAVVESRKRWKSCHTNACLLVCDCIRKAQPLPGPSALSKCAPNTYNLEREEWPSGCGWLTTHFYFCLTDGLSERTVLDFFFLAVSTHSRHQLPFKAILSLSPPHCFKILLECVTMLKDIREALESGCMYRLPNACAHFSIMLFYTELSGTS